MTSKKFEEWDHKFKPLFKKPGAVLRLPNAGFVSIPSDAWGSTFLAKEIDDELLKAYEEELKWVE